MIFRKPPPNKRVEADALDRGAHTKGQVPD
jgi:hypothetical protein